MKAIEILINEHRLILKFLDLLDTVRDGLIRGEVPPKEFFERSVNFAREFADKFHHFKEEYIMFSLLAKKRNGLFKNEVNRLRNQHESSRAYIDNVFNSFNRSDKISNKRIKSIDKNLWNYIIDLRDHIDYEDNIFFPLVERELSDEDLDLIHAEFIKINGSNGGRAFEKGREHLKILASLLKGN
ncbi:MAG: hypothetical protein GY839_02705 [candidate division Zixibacteria bacterium]|nr:hypothetical protein [candidate division Zixibacteria bacterium]